MVQAINSDEQEVMAKSKHGWPLGVLLAAILVTAALLFGANYVLVRRPVTAALKQDPRNAPFTLQAHYQYFLNPKSLTLNLSRADAVSPADLYRGLFQAAKALHDVGREFDKVILARSSVPVFLLDGDDFDGLGFSYGANENPVYLIRTLPEKLLRPDAAHAYSTWEGGWLGVLSKQMDDANAAAGRWINGE